MRFAEKLLFTMTDLELDPRDSSDDADETRDIADVIAEKATESHPFNKQYAYGFISVQEGIKAYSKALEVLAVSNGVECMWEAVYSNSFMTQSKLSSDFASLRELEDHAITRQHLSLPSPEKLASSTMQLLPV